MKKILQVLSIMAVMSLSCGQDPGMKADAIAESHLIIDVRTPGEYNQGHLDRAINIPYDEIDAKIADHTRDKAEKITLYCRSGRRSAIAKQTLDSMGYQQVVDAGAYAKLKAQAD